MKNAPLLLEVNNNTTNNSNRNNRDSNYSNNINNMSSATYDTKIETRGRGDDADDALVNFFAYDVRLACCDCALLDPPINPITK